MVNPSTVIKAFYLQAVRFFLNCGYNYTSISWRRASLSSWWIPFIRHWLERGGGDSRYHSDLFSYPFRFVFSREWQVCWYLRSLQVLTWWARADCLRVSYRCSQWWMLMGIIPILSYLKLDGSALKRLVLSTDCAVRHQLYPQWSLVLWSHICHQRNIQMLPVNHQGEVLVKDRCS